MRSGDELFGGFSLALLALLAAIVVLASSPRFVDAERTPLSAAERIKVRSIGSRAS